MRRLHPASMVVAFLPKLVEAARTALPVVLVSFASSRGDRSELILALIGILGGFGAIGAYISTRFDVADGHLMVKSGILFRRDRRIPLSQIQNVNLKQGVIERLLRVVTVEVETAASAGAEMKLQVLAEAEAERLKSELMEAHRHAEPEAAHEQIYRVTKADLLLGALTENEALRLLIFVLPGISGVGLYRALAKNSIWAELPIPGWVFALAGGLVLAILMIGGWIGGAVSYSMKYAGFTVRREPGLYRIAYGLLTKVQFVLKLRRIEFVAVSATLWQRWIGRCTVHVGTAATFGEQGASAPIGLMVKRDEAARIVEAVAPGAGLERIRWQRLPAYFMYVVAVRQLVVIAALCAAWYWVLAAPLHPIVKDLFQWGVVMPTVLAAMLLAGGVVSARASGYALGENVFAVRHGFLKQHVHLIPFERIEIIRSSAPPWWRRRGVTDLHVRAMIHAVSVPMLPQSDAETLVEEVRRVAAERRRERRIAGARDTALAEANDWAPKPLLPAE